jgi:hypothetical protein
MSRSNVLPDPLLPTMKIGRRAESGPPAAAGEDSTTSKYPLALVGVTFKQLR